MSAHAIIACWKRDKKPSRLLKKFLPIRGWGVYIIAGLVLAACSSETESVQMVPDENSDSSVIQAAVDDHSRPESHVKRDAARNPFDVLRASGIKPGQKVVDIAPGGGYYTALLSRIVGPEGQVMAIDPARLLQAYPNAGDAFRLYLEQDPIENLSYSVQKLDELSVPASVDMAFMMLYYHDTVWTGVNRGKMNKAIYKALKPGGIYFVIDHQASLDMEDLAASKSLHRIHDRRVKSEIKKAGFEFIGQYGVLSNTEDPHNVSVFDENWRGKTDRFILKFRRPH